MQHFTGYDAINLATRYGVDLQHARTGKSLSVEDAKLLAEQDDQWVAADVDLNALEGAVTGVVSNHTPMYLEEEMFERDGIDLAWFQHLQDCEGQCSECRCTHERIDCSCYGVKPHEYLPAEDFHDCCGPQECGDFLIGSWKLARAGYEPDPEKGNYSAIVRETTTQVVWSKYKKLAAKCSPCYPNQGDLDNPGDILAYDLPPDIYGDE